MPKKIGFFFDLDGTLVNTASDFIAAVRHTLSDDLNLPEEDEELKKMISLGFKGMLGICAPSLDDEQVEDCRQKFLSYYEKNIVVNSRFYAGLDTLIMDLQERGVCHGIVTNRSIDLSVSLLTKLLPEWNRNILIGEAPDSIYPAKPKPDRLLRAFELAGVSAEHCYYFGDYSVDIEAARAANCTSVAVEFGFHHSDSLPEQWGADFVLKTPKDVVEFIEARLT